MIEMRRVSSVAIENGYDVVAWRDNCSPMIRVRDGEPAYANRIGDKRTMVDTYQDGDVLLLAWTGRYRTDVLQGLEK